MAVEADGQILVTDHDGEVIRVDPVTGIQTVLTSALGDPVSILVDANGSLQADTLGDGVIWRVQGTELQRVVDTSVLGAPRLMLDPVHGDVLADGRLVVADANADPLGLGADGTGKGVYGTGHGALLAIDPDVPSITTLLADAQFVAPVAVVRVRP